MVVFQTGVVMPCCCVHAVAFVCVDVRACACVCVRRAQWCVGVRLPLWETQQVISAGDRVEQDSRLMTYDSGPLQSDMTVTGSPLLHLALGVNKPDTVVFVYLEEVFADGRVVYVVSPLCWCRRAAVNVHGFLLTRLDQPVWLGSHSCVCVCTRVCVSVCVCVCVCVWDHFCVCCLRTCVCLLPVHLCLWDACDDDHDDDDDDHNDDDHN